MEKLTFPNIRRGDRFTMTGYYVHVPNPARRWWQFWKPRLVTTDELQTFAVINAPDTPDALTR